MNKKYIAAAVMLLAIVVVFAACKGKNEGEPTTAGQGGIMFGDILVSTEANGDLYVTNPTGDKIPVTTSEDGFYDDLEALLTETATKTPPTSGTTVPPASGSTTTTTEPTTNTGGKPTEPSTAQTETTTNKPIDIGNNGSQGGSISWDDPRW